MVDFLDVGLEGDDLGVRQVEPRVGRGGAGYLCEMVIRSFQNSMLDMKPDWLKGLAFGVKMETYCLSTIS